MAYSKQREQILCALKGISSHPTAEELYLYLKPANPALSLGTVYRNLNQLSEQGYIQKLSDPSGTDKFDSSPLPHGHLFCVKCKRIFDIDISDLHLPFSQIEMRYGCSLIHNRALLFGACAECEQS